MNHKFKIFLRFFFPIISLSLFILLIYLSKTTKLISLETIKTYQYELKDLINKHFFLMSTLFIFINIALATFSLPGKSLLGVICGFLFPLPWSTSIVVIGSALGAISIFMIAKTAIGDSLKEKTAPFLKKMEAGFQKHSANYLLFLRFSSSLFPFWAVNLASAFLGVRLITYIWTTFIGIIPGSYVSTLAGSGLGEIFDRNEAFSWNTVFNTQIKIALFFLAFFSLIPIFIKRYLIKSKG